MATQTQSVDDLLVCLMSMGFSLEDGQAAVQNGYLSVERAVEWILAGKPGETVPDARPRLQLRPTLENQSNPFVNPLVPVPTESGPPSTSQNRNVTMEQSSQPPTEDSQSAPTEDSQSETVISRLHLSDNQKKLKNDFETKRRKEAKDDALKEKQRRKRDHERVLKEIAQDREKKKMTSHLNKTETADRETNKSTTTPPSTSTTPPSTSTADRCQLQLRLPAGDVVKQTYPASEPFQTIWEFAIKTCSSSDIVLIQPFPHREFTVADVSSSLLDLQLTPSASLMVKRKDPQKSSPGVEAFQNQQSASGSTFKLSGQGQTTADQHKTGFQAPFVVPNVHEEEIEHHIDEEEQMVEDDEEAGQDEAEDYPFHHGMPPGFPAALGGLGGLQLGMGLGAGGGNQAAFEGVGQRLVPIGQPGNEDVHHNVPAAQLAAEKARERFANPDPVMPDRQSAPVPSTLTYDVSPLALLCMNHIAQRLTQHDPRHPLLSLSGISQEVAQKILTYLLREKLLRPRALNAFIPCFLREMILDCYPYTTNELLHVVRYHCQLQTLSLKSCSLITDAGLLELNSLKKLKHLNLSGCKQLTDKCLEIVKDMPCLVSLILDGTGITEAGFIGIVPSLPSCLQVVNLNRTNVTEAIFSHLKELENLKVLHLEHTKVCGLSGIDQLKKLEAVDFSQTDIVTESLLCLGDSVTCLAVSNTQRINGDQALQYIQRLALRSLSLPSRLTTTDVGLQFISHMPLSELDLTNYINVGDVGMIHIGKIETLKKLLLSNTKITDVGMTHLKNLKQLQILYLDRTLVSDECADIVKCFHALIELSLSSTSLTSRFLCNGALDSSHDLSKLNLCRTSVSNKGVSCLKSDSLCLVNLDGTCVKPNIVDILHNQCPNLKRVTVAQIRPVNSDDED